MGAGGPGVRVFGTDRGGSKPGILTGNGAVFIGTKGVMMLPHIARAQLFPEKDFENWTRPKDYLEYHDAVDTAEWSGNKARIGRIVAQKQ